MSYRTTLLLLLPLLANPAVYALHDQEHSAAGGSYEGLLERSLELMDTDPVEALTLAKNAWAYAESSTDRVLQLRTLRAIGSAELEMCLHMEFMQTALHTLDIAMVTGEPRHIASALKDLSLAYRVNLRPDQAVVEAKRSLAMLLPLNDTIAIADAHHFLMSTLLHAGKYADALAIASSAMEICTELNDEICQARVHRSIAAVLIEMGKHADALPFLTRSERVLKEKGNDIEQFEIAIDRTRIMLGLGLTHYARISMDEADALLARTNRPQHKAALRQLRYELALAMKQWETALAHLQQIKAENDSMEIAKVNLKMAGLQVLHETQIKEQDNALLRDLNAQQAETIVGQRSSNRNLVILLCGVLALVVALFLTSRHNLRMMRRLARKNQVIRKQHDEIQSKVLELKRQNLRLAESLMSEEEKELILKEIHHRVKNNLQVVDSLLNIQSNEVDDPVSKRILKDAQGRIRSMAMVHEHIYRSSGDLHASLRAHFERLGRSVLVAHGAHDRISIHVDTDLPTFPAETLLPLSLVVNELLTNSLKHAFEGMEGGSIRITLHEATTGYELRYSDDGVGIGRMAGTTASYSFGHELVNILAHQLNGEVHMINGPGAALCMTFIPDKELLRKAS